MVERWIALWERVCSAVQWTFLNRRAGLQNPTILVWGEPRWTIHSVSENAFTAGGVRFQEGP